jgi:WXG100 family type VII secretion target
MEGNILVTPEQLEQTSAEFKSAASTIQAITDDMINTVTNISSTWGGEASTAYISSFKTFQDNFTKLKNMIDAHANSLTELANLYKTTEQENVQTASQVQGNILE